MVSTAYDRRLAAPVSSGRVRRVPVEGWSPVLLHATLVVLMAGAIVRVDRPERFGILVPLALGGGILGFSLAKTHVVDLFAHVTAFLVGAMAAITISAVRYDDINGGWRTTLDRLQTRADRLYQAFDQAKPLDDDLLVAVIGITIWLVGYSSAWMLYRRGWLGPAVMLPGVVILTSLGLDRDAPSAPLFIYVAVAMMLAARHFAFRRQVAWRRSRIAAPAGLPSRFLAAGSTVAAVAVAVGIVLPVSAPDSLLNTVTDQADSVIANARRVWERFAPGGGNGEGAGTYADFPPSFQIGGPIDLPDTPAALLQANTSTYLAIRRYNIYDGHNWDSDVDRTFRFPNEGKDVHATRATFLPSQPVTLSQEVLKDRTPVSGVVTAYLRKSGLIYTLGTHAWSSEPTTVILGWRQIDDLAIRIHAVDGNTVPIDLVSLLAALQQASFTPSQNGGEPSVAQPDLAASIAQMRASLESSYPIATRIELDNGEPVLHVSGRLPIYDDIEAVFGDDQASARPQYLVNGLMSTAKPASLRRAGTDYPAYVRGRYLQLPDTVTNQTRQLAANIIDQAGASNPFDQAKAIEEYLRATYPYVLDSDTPPSDRDFVDYFLFAKQAGRCEHFATAMVVMMRTLGVPARLVSGYSPGAYDPTRQGFLSLESNAHTWVEIYFPKYGWLTFEPTPTQKEVVYGASNNQPTATPEPTAIAAPTPTPLLTPTAEASPVAAVTNDAPRQPKKSIYDRTIGRLTWLAVALIGLAAVLISALSGAWLWGLRGLQPRAANYKRALRVARLWGVRPDPTMTPKEFATEFGRAVPSSRGAIEVVTEHYTAEQYGGRTATTGGDSSDRLAWRDLRSTLRRWRPWRKRPGRVMGQREAAGD